MSDEDTTILLIDYVEVADLDIGGKLRQRLDLAGLEVGSIEAIGYPGAELSLGS